MMKSKEVNEGVESLPSYPRYTPMTDVGVPLVKSRLFSWCTTILVAYNVCLTLAICLLYFSLSSEVDTLRNSCNKSKSNGTAEIEQGCQNYQTVNNMEETGNGLISSIEMLLKQYEDGQQHETSSEPVPREKKCNTTEEVLMTLLRSDDTEDHTRIQRAKNSQRRTPVGFAHFHAGSVHGTNYPVYRYVDFWHAADWVDNAKFKMDNLDGAASKVTVHSRGLYYIYSQVTFKDVNRYHGYTVFVDDQPHLQCYFENPLSQCRRSAQTGACEGTREDRCAVCYTGGLVYIDKKQKISVQMIFDNRIVSGDKADTFFGLLKVK